MNDTESEDVLQTVNFYMSGVVLLVVCVFGLVSNSLVAVVLTHKSSMDSSTSVFLLALSFFDSLVLICTMFLICFKELSEVYSRLVHPNIMPYVYPLALTAQTSTIWITVSFTVERYIAVTHPLKASTLCTVKRAKVVTAVVAFISVLYNITRWFEYRTERETHPNNTSNSTAPALSYKLDPTDLELSPQYESIYFTGLYLAIMCIIPVTTLSILNYLLIQAVRRSMKGAFSVGTKSNSPKDNNVTIMLVSVVAVFIVCQVPALVYNVAYGVAKETVKTSVSWEILSIVRNFMVTLNSAVNFILYCALGQNFRKVFLRLFCKRVPMPPGSYYDRRTYSTNSNCTGSLRNTASIPMLDKNSNSKHINLATEKKEDIGL